MVQLAVESLLVGSLRFIEVIQIDVIEPEDKVRDGTIGTQPD